MEISLHILDIVENAAAAGASLVEIEIDETDLAYDVTVTDDGVGMSEKSFRSLSVPDILQSRTAAVSDFRS